MCTEDIHVFSRYPATIYKVWYEGLLNKLKKPSWPTIFIIWIIFAWHIFSSQYRWLCSARYPKIKCTPGSILGPYLYLTTDLPGPEDTTTTTFIDATAILTANINPEKVSQKLQNLLQDWFKQRETQVNAEKKNI